MRVFDIYQHPKYGTEAVRRGFSWTAFLVPSVWAVRRGLGMTTVLLVVTSTMMFDLARSATDWANNPLLLGLFFATLVVIFGIKPGLKGYRWHARELKQEDYSYKCTVVASSHRKAIRAANDEHYDASIKIAAA